MSIIHPLNQRIFKPSPKSSLSLINIGTNSFIGAASPSNCQQYLQISGISNHSLVCIVPEPESAASRNSRVFNFDYIIFHLDGNNNDKYNLSAPSIAVSITKSATNEETLFYALISHEKSIFHKYPPFFPHHQNPILYIPPSPNSKTRSWK